MDILRTDELKPGHRIKLTTPLPNKPDSEYAVVQQVVQIDPGTTVPIYRIDFEGSSWGLAANGDREFEVESTAAGLLRWPSR